MDRHEAIQASDAGRHPRPLHAWDYLVGAQASAGAFGSSAAFSFNGNKIITTSGGRMLVSHRSDWNERPGSVVPAFCRQIDAGVRGVTVSHPSVRQYFMLASETVQLVLQVAGAAEPGTTYVLDMGEQIKVVDLARDVARLKGLIPDDEMAIQFTALAPGERRYEELANRMETVSPSPVEQILRVRAKNPIDPVALDTQLDQLADAALREDRDEVRRILRRIVPEFAEDGL